MSNIVQYVLQLRNQMSGPLSQAQAAVSRLQQRLAATQSTAQSTGSKLGELGTVAAGAFSVYALAEFGKGIVMAGAKMEQTRVQFETFAGSAEAGNAVIAKLQKFSLATPFDDEQVLKAGKSLMAFGTDAGSLEAVLTRIGNISSATGKDFNELTTIYGKAKTAGTLYAEDINQLVEAGIPIIDEFAKQLGVPTSQVKKLASQGKISFGMLEKGFDNLGGKSGKWGSLMEKQSQTVAGKWSSLVGTMQNLSAKLGEALLPFISSVLDKALPALVKFGGIIMGLPKFIDDNKYALGAVAVAMLALNAETIALGIAQTGYNIVTKAVTLGQWALNAAMTANPIGIVVAAIAALVAGMMYLYKNNELVRASMDAFAAAVKSSFLTIFESAKTILGGVGHLIKGIFTFDKEELKKGLSAMAEGGKMAATTFQKAQAAGMKAGVKSIVEFRAEKAAEKTGAADKAREASKGTKAALDKGKGDKDSKLSTKVGDVSGTKLTSIHLTIQKLTGIENNHMTTVKEGAADLKRLVMETLTGAINDTVIMAGQN